MTRADADTSIEVPGATSRSDATGGLRIVDAAVRPAWAVSFTYNGSVYSGLQGETVAAALAAANVALLGHRKDGTARGLWCGMGVCQECLVNIDGKPSLRACMTTLCDGMSVSAQGYLARLPAPAPHLPRASPPAQSPQVLVVGAGPAGLSAARAAALCGAAVTIIDERAKPGGQYFKQLAASHTVSDSAHTDAQAKRGRDLIDQVETLGVKIVRNATVWGAFEGKEIGVHIDGAGVQHMFMPDRLILATGAYERGVPVPGWTLPGYMTTGAAQTMLRAYRVVPGRRVLVAGNGPLNLQLAAELVMAGVEVVAVVEAAPKPELRSLVPFVQTVFASSALVRNGLRYLAQLRRAGVAVMHSSAVVSARGVDRVQACSVARIDADGRPVAGSATDFVVDTVCAGYGFLPSNELPRALGCQHVRRRGQHHALETVTDADGQTSVSGIYAIGDMIRLAGAHAAQHQGFVTGCAVALSLELQMPTAVASELGDARRMLLRHQRFQHGLWKLFSAPTLTDQLMTADTTVCRCESVAAHAIRTAIQNGAITLGAVKRRTRACMGRCQGRYCESTVAAMLPDAPEVQRDEGFNLAPRVPIKPTRLRDIA